MSCTVAKQKDTGMKNRGFNLKDFVLTEDKDRHTITIVDI